MHEALLDHELSVIRYTFATLMGTEEVFYRSKTGVYTYKAIFESFYRNQYVEANEIDAFVDVLNLEKKKWDRKSSSYRLFLYSTMMPNVSHLNRWRKHQSEKKTNRSKHHNTNCDNIN
ncbi:hypothetical protein HanIR_Chr05g0239371 [Helianthus annuus]|nr:hypothetical protein HanIR_Chr05g0239371 [Helianthus annuus]